MGGYSSPLLDDYNKTGVVTPALQKALDLAKQRMTAQVNAGQPAPAQPAQPAPNVPEAPAMPMPFSAPAPRSVMGPAPAPLPLSQSPRMQNLQAEHDRLTDPTLASSKPGVEQIHNPWLRTPLRVLDAIGSGFFPGVMAGIPGTGLHHQVLVKQNEARQNELQKGATEEATREHLGAETQELGARTGHEQAETEALPGTTESENALRGAQTTHLGAETGAIEHPPGEFKTEHVLTPDGSVIQIKTNSRTGETTHDVIFHGTGEKGEIKSIQRNGKPHEILFDRNGKELKDLGETGQKPSENDHGSNFVDPTSGVVTRVLPGGTVPKGNVSETGLSSERVKEQEGEAAQAKARSDAQKEYQLAQQLVAKPSPTNDLALVMRYIGATKPDSLGKLRLNNNEVSLVMGTRSTFGDLEALAEKVRNGQMLTPKQRQDMLDTMKTLTGAGEQAQPSGGQAQGGYKVGSKYGGLTYLGGDPNSEGSWQK